jgi:manganese efflux pump family protein
MDFITLILLAVGLCFDTFAVSVSCGLIVSHIRFWQAVRIALIMAFFQGLNPVLGWLAGTSVLKYIINFDHWLAFGLLTAIGVRMILESMKKEERRNYDPLKFSTTLWLAIATSIDALVVGVSLAFVKVNILWAGFNIGTITFIAAMLGMLFGKKTGERFSRRMEIVGGIVLILIGIKIVLEHTC